MTRVSLQKFEETFLQQGSQFADSKVRAGLKSFLEELDNLDGQDDGFIDGNAMNKIEVKWREHYDTFTGVTTGHYLFGKQLGPYPASPEVKVLLPFYRLLFKNGSANERLFRHTLFPRSLKTAESFLGRHRFDYYYSEKDKNSEQTLQKTLRNYNMHFCDRAVRWFKQDLSHLKAEKTVQLEFDELPTDEKLLVLQFFEKFHPRTFIRLFRGLFPELQYLSDKPNLEVAKQCLQEIEQSLEDWKAGKISKAEAYLKVQVRRHYLSFQDRLINSYQNPKFEEEEKTVKAIQELSANFLKELYDPAFFDTDADGVMDETDPFPLHQWYRRDQDGDQIPDSLTETQQGPANFYGLQEGEAMDFSPEGMERRIQIHRVQGQVYLVAKIGFVTEHQDVLQELPYFRAVWKARIESMYQKILPPEMGPVQVLVDFHSPEGAEVKINDTYRHVTYSYVREGEEVIKTAGATANTFPRYPSTVTLAHEIAHHFLLRDRYESSPYVESCQDVAPGLLVLPEDDHLMNNKERHPPKLDPVDLIHTIQVTRESGSPLQVFDLVRAEIYFKQGNFQAAEDLYGPLYQKYSADFKNHSNDSNAQSQLQVARLAAMRGLILSQLKRYEILQDAELGNRIKKNIAQLESQAKPHAKTDPNFQEALIDAKLLQAFLKKAQGHSEEVFPLLDQAREMDEFNQGKFAALKISQIFPDSVEVKRKGIVQFGLQAGLAGDVLINVPDSYNPLNPEHGPKLYGTLTANVGYPLIWDGLEFGAGASLKFFFSPPNERYALATMARLWTNFNLYRNVNFIQHHLSLAGGPLIDFSPSYGVMQHHFPQPSNNVLGYVEGSYSVEMANWLIAGVGVGGTLGPFGNPVLFVSLGLERSLSELIFQPAK